MNSTSIEHVNIADARKRLDELIDRAAGGETIVIERGDGAAARLAPQPRAAAANTAARYDWDSHLRWLEQQPGDPRASAEIDAELRSLDRY